MQENPHANTQANNLILLCKPMAWFLLLEAASEILRFIETTKHITYQITECFYYRDLRYCNNGENFL